MRQGQHQHPKKNRGRNRRPSNSGNRVYESNGPDVKIRGNASHVSEKYLALARDAQVSGDPVASENYLQHAEHYLRIIAAAQAQQPASAQPCAPEEDEQPQEETRDNGARQSRGRGRPSGPARGNSAAQPVAQDRSSEEIAASEEASNAPGDDELVNGTEPAAKDEAVTVKAVAVEAVSEEPSGDAAEEETSEAG